MIAPQRRVRMVESALMALIVSTALVYLDGEAAPVKKHTVIYCLATMEAHAHKR